MAEEENAEFEQSKAFTSYGVSLIQYSTCPRRTTEYQKRSDLSIKANRSYQRPISKSECGRWSIMAPPRIA